MNKTAKFFTLLSTSMLLLAGCSSDEEPVDNDAEVAEDEESTITYWQHSSAARDSMIESIVEDFEAENPNIEVELEFIPEDSYNQKLITALGSGEAPDVFQIESGMVPKLIAADTILPLDPEILPKDYIESEFIESTIEALSFEDEYYGVPTDTQTIIQFWNKDLLEEEGYDPEVGADTWDEFFERARTLTEHDGDTMVQSGWGVKGFPREVVAYVAQNEGTFFDEEKQEFVFADDENALEAIKEYASLYRDDKVYDIDFEANWAGFRQGLVAQMLGHPAMIGNLKETAPDLDFGISVIPANGSNRQTAITSWAYVMSTDADTIAATKFIDYLSSEEVQKTWTQETGELPSRKVLLEDEDLLADPQTKVALESLEDAVPGRMQTRPLYVIWGDGFEEIMHTDREIEEILKDVQDALNEEYNKKI